MCSQNDCTTILFQLLVQDIIVHYMKTTNVNYVAQKKSTGYHKDVWEGKKNVRKLLVTRIIEACSSKGSAGQSNVQRTLVLLSKSVLPGLWNLHSIVLLVERGHDQLHQKWKGRGNYCSTHSLLVRVFVCIHITGCTDHSLCSW